jgi:putative hydrolase of the HAD superfamily
MPDFAVVLDLDDTLLVQREAFEEACFATCAAAWAECDVEPDVLAESVKNHAQRLWSESEFAGYFQRIGLTADEGLWTDFAGDEEPLGRIRPWGKAYHRAAWRCALTDHGVDDNALAERCAVMFQEERWACFALFHDTVATVEALSQRYRLALVTNGLVTLQHKKIERAGLTPYFQTVVISGEFGVGMPDPVMYTTALERLGVAPERAVMAGNDQEWDVAGPQKVGIKSIWANMAGEPAREDVKPDATVNSLGELPDVVEGLLG